MNDEVETKTQMATLGQEKENLRSSIQEHPVKAVEGSSRSLDPTQKADKVQHDTATFAARMDTPPAGSVKRYITKKCNELKTKKQLRNE